MTRTYGAIALDTWQNRWTISALDPHVRIRLKQIFPRIRREDPPPYHFPNTMHQATDLEWFLSRYPLDISDADLASLRAGHLQFQTHRAEMERILLPGYTPPAYAGLRPGQTLRPYQAQAVEVLFGAGGLLLGDDVGLGKTFVTAGACLKPGALPAVVVCYGHLQVQWCGVIERFTNLTAYPIRHAAPYSVPPADVYVFRYSQLLGWADYWSELKPGLVAFDEVQELRTGSGSAKGRSAKTLSRVATYRLGLSATPIYNYGREIWQVMRFIRPEALGSYNDFLREWTGDGGLIDDPAALGTYLREQHAFLRRTKRDVGQDMPAVNRIVQPVEHDEAELRSIDEWARDMARIARTGEWAERGKATRELDLRVRHQTGVSKAKAVARFVRLIVEGGEPVVLAGWHRDVYDIWMEELKDFSPAMYTGSESTAQKARQVRHFVDGGTPIFIMSLRAGAGLDGLQARSSTIVFGELDWSPGVHHQCIGRLDREGQSAPVTAIFLVADDGSDPPMMEVNGLKAAEAAHIVDPNLGVQATHSDTTHIQKLVDRYLNRKVKTPPPPPPQQLTMV